MNLKLLYILILNQLCNDVMKQFAAVKGFESWNLSNSRLILLNPAHLLARLFCTNGQGLPIGLVLNKRTFEANCHCKRVVLWIGHRLNRSLPYLGRCEPHRLSARGSVEKILHYLSPGPTPSTQPNERDS